MAAGMSFKKENLPVLRERLNQNCGLSEEDLIPVIHIDVPMPLDYISEGFIQELDLLEPFGKGNPKPIFAERHFKILRASVIGKCRCVMTAVSAWRLCILGISGSLTTMWKTCMGRMEKTVCTRDFQIR